MNHFSIFENHESNVRSYCRQFPAIFCTAHGSRIVDENGRDYIDFFAGAGALNYGHNNPHIKARLLEYLSNDGVTHSLDFFTVAKANFIERFVEVILRPRSLHYKLQFTGPTGTNAVEAALKLARKITGRQNVVAFTNAFHGVSLGALAATTNRKKREAACVPLHYVTRMPFDRFFGDDIDTAEIIEGIYKIPGGGIERPAAFIVELVQGEGGLNVASKEWLQRIAKLAKELGALFIVDDIQSGCGRTGTFFSFENMEIQPDIVCLSKSLGGMGMPLAVTLIRPDLDKWEAGEHNGTFRGNNLAFIAATTAFGYWSGEYDFGASLDDKAGWLQSELEDAAKMFAADDVELRGRGLFRGMAFRRSELAESISEAAFRHGVIAETCGPRNGVLKFMPPLVIDQNTLKEGFEKLQLAMKEVLEDAPTQVEHDERVYAGEDVSSQI